MKKAKYRQLVDKYKKEIESLREDILALVGDDCMLKYQTHKRWEMILSTGDSMMFGSKSTSEQGKCIFDKISNLSGKNTPLDILKEEIKHNLMYELASPVYDGMFDRSKLNPVMANEHTPIDVNFGGKHAPTIGSSATKIVAPDNDDYLSVARGLFCTGIDHAAYFILNGYTFSHKKGCLLKCVDNKTGQKFNGEEAEMILQLLVDGA